MPDPSTLTTNDCVAVPAVAVNVTFCVLETADAEALNVADVAPAFTVTAAGTLRALLEVLSVIAIGLASAPLNWTEHAVVAGPVRLCVVHETSVRVAAGAGYRVTAFVFVTPLAWAVIVTVVALLTFAVTALKVAELWPAAICTPDGTFNAGLLLDNCIVIGARAVAVRDSEHDFDCGPVRDWVPQEISLSAT